MLLTSIALAQSCTVQVVCDGQPVGAPVALPTPTCDTDPPPPDTDPPIPTGDTGAPPSTGIEHVIVLLWDDVGWGSTSLMGTPGPPVGVTPTLDTLAGMAGTVVYEQAYAAAQCSPARASLLTGRQGRRVGVRTAGYALSTEGRALSVAHELEADGVATMYLGKWHLDGTQGGGQDMLRPVPVSAYDPTAAGFGDWRAGNGVAGTGPWLLGTPTGFIEHSGHYSDVLTSLALDHVTQATGPTWTVVAYEAAHEPWTPTAADHAAALAAGVASEPGTSYYGEVHDLDRQLGDLLAGLNTAGLSGSTLVLVWSDNGARLDDLTGAMVWPKPNGEMRGEKQDMWEGGIRVPALAILPSALPATWTQPVSLYDIPDTLREWRGLPEDPSDDGASILGTLTGVAPSRAGGLPFAGGVGADPSHNALVAADGLYKVVENGNFRNLFALPNDTNAISGQQPALKDQLFAELDPWVASTVAEEAAQTGTRGPINWWTAPEYAPHWPVLCARPEYAAVPECAP